MEGGESDYYYFNLRLCKLKMGGGIKKAQNYITILNEILNIGIKELHFFNNIKINDSYQNKHFFKAYI